MEIDAKEVAKGMHDGKIVWICDYRHTDIVQKPIRHVEPTKVKIRPITEVKSKIYYSNSFFSPLKKNGDVAAKIIKVYDNTGFRSYPGEPVNIFTTEEECRTKYNLFMIDIKNQLKTYISVLNKQLLELENKIELIGD